MTDDPSAPLPPALSLGELKRELAARGIVPSRRRGQNFCVDANAARAVVRDAGVAPGDVVLEVGPGAGHLTLPLAAAGARVLAVEYDRGLFGFLRERLGPAGLPVTLLHEDVLGSKHELNPRVTAAVRRMTADAGADGFRVVSNLPYSVATPFLLTLVMSDLPWQAPR